MSTNLMHAARPVVAAGGIAAGLAKTAAGHDVDTLIKQIKDDDDDIRTNAWQRASSFGASAVKPLADLMAVDELEVARAAKRGLWRVTRHAGRPGHARPPVVRALIGLLGDDRPDGVRGEVVWMLSEIGGDDAVAPVAGLLGDKALREHARMTLERIPGPRSLAALRTAMTGAPDDFKPNLAQSLRKRGVEVPGLPCRKRVPREKIRPKLT